MTETYWVLTADQRHSRSGPDLVPAALSQLARALPPNDCVLPPSRTAGDEFQVMLASPTAVIRAVTALLRSADWRLGLGFGAVETPLPKQTNEARGPAFLHAREAVNAARSQPMALRVRSDAPDVDNHAAEGAIWMLAALLESRTDPGWEVVDLVAGGLTQKDAAAKLGISQAAVSQRLSAAGYRVQVHGEAACIRLLELLESAAVRRLTHSSARTVSGAWEG